jgi:hypothetical protein
MGCCCGLRVCVCVFGGDGDSVIARESEEDVANDDAYSSERARTRFVLAPQVDEEEPPPWTTGVMLVDLDLEEEVVVPNDGASFKVEAVAVAHN